MAALGRARQFLVDRLGIPRTAALRLLPDMNESGYVKPAFRFDTTSDR